MFQDKVRFGVNPGLLALMGSNPAGAELKAKRSLSAPFCFYPYLSFRYFVKRDIITLDRPAASRTVQVRHSGKRRANEVFLPRCGPHSVHLPKHAGLRHLGR